MLCICTGSVLLGQHGKISEAVHHDIRLDRARVFAENLLLLGHTSENEQSTDARVDTELDIGKEVVTDHERPLRVEVMSDISYIYTDIVPRRTRQEWRPSLVCVVFQ